MKYFASIQREFLKYAIVFSSKEEFEEYMKKHPKGDRQNHSIKVPKLGDEEHSLGQSRMFTNKGWLYFDQDDEGRKDLDEERRKLQSFLKREE